MPLKGLGSDDRRVGCWTARAEVGGQRSASHPPRPAPPLSHPPSTPAPPTNPPTNPTPLTAESTCDPAPPSSSTNPSPSHTTAWAPSPPTIPRSFSTSGAGAILRRTTQAIRYPSRRSRRRACRAADMAEGRSRPSPRHQRPTLCVLPHLPQPPRPGLAQPAPDARAQAHSPPPPSPHPPPPHPPLLKPGESATETETRTPDTGATTASPSPPCRRRRRRFSRTTRLRRIPTRTRASPQAQVQPQRRGRWPRPNPTRTPKPRLKDKPTSCRKTQAKEAGAEAARRPAAPTPLRACRKSTRDAYRIPCRRCTIRAGRGIMRVGEEVGRGVWRVSVWGGAWRVV